MNLDFSALWGDPARQILQGLVMTLKLSAWSLLIAFLIGLVFGVVRWLRIRLLEPVCWFYVEFSRNTPPVVQILFWYFSASYILPHWLFLELRDFGYEFGAAVVALAIYHGAFVAEVIRAGLNSVDRGQFEASRALGLGLGESLRFVVLPQALRVIVPLLVNEATALIKNTSLAMAIGVVEMTYVYKNIDNFMFRGVEALTVITIVYMIVCLVTAGLGALLSRRLSRHTTARLGRRPVLTSE